MNDIRIPIDKSALKPALKHKAAKWWIVFFVGMIALTFIVSSILFLTHTAQNNALIRKEMALIKEEMKLVKMEEQVVSDKLKESTAAQEEPTNRRWKLLHGEKGKLKVTIIADLEITWKQH